MQNATPPKSYSNGKQKNKEIALANNLFVIFSLVFYIEYANGLFFNFPIEDIVKATDVIK